MAKPRHQLTALRPSSYAFPSHPGCRGDRYIPSFAQADLAGGFARKVRIANLHSASPIMATETHWRGPMGSFGPAQVILN